MAITLRNFVGFETGGTEEVDGQVGSPAVNSTAPVKSGTYSLKLDGAATAAQVDFNIDLLESASRGLYGFHFQTNDVTPTNDVDIFAIVDTAGAAHFALRLKTTGNVDLIDANGAVQATITSPFTVNTWHFIEVGWKRDNTVGKVIVDINGGSELSETNFDNNTGTSAGVIRFTGAGTNNEDIVLDNFYERSASADGDIVRANFFGNAEVFKYQSVKASATPDDGGGNLNAGTWDKAGETPLAATATNPEYTDTGAGAVDSDATNGSPEGPANDPNIDGDSNIKGMKGISNMKRAGGGDTAHFILMGNDVDGTTRSADLDPTTAFVNYFFLSEAATIVPLSTEHCRIGFEMDDAQDYECQEQWAMLLHVPAAAAFLFRNRQQTYLRM